MKKKGGQNWLVVIVGVVLRTIIVVKNEGTLIHFLENLSCPLLKIELLLIVFFDFKREVALEDSVFSEHYV